MVPAARRGCLSAALAARGVATAAAPVDFRRLRRETGASAAAAVQTTKMARARGMAAQLTVLCGLGS